MVKPLLAVETLTVERGGRTIFANLSFTLAAGEAIHVKGRNGAGKSTLLRALSGLLPAKAGRITYALADAEVRGIETLHYLGYEDALKPSLTVRENLEFWTSMLGDDPAAGPRERGTTRSAGEAGPAGDADPKPRLPTFRSPSPLAARGEVEALSAFGISRLADLPAAYLSAGQKRRVALARLLVAGRPIWLLDEPLIALDTAAQQILTTIMDAHLGGGGAILVASHQPLALACREIDLAARLEPA